ncbi:MAG: flagellar hook-basal body complex protein FliE [Oscillospiraceae bacterium]|nr:flagellar hook-basal body complex protein FliE [Oscillospiraceae bacterium]MDD6083149.1 flagellar hook-basal body complex protein FliE [Oscillospiraceae bacterium]
MISTTFITPLTSMPTVSSLDKDSNNLSSNEENSELSFSETLRQKIQNVKDLEQKSLDSAYAVSMGQTEDIEGAMIDATRASVAIETAVQITTRAVNAYKEIVQMQI